MGGAEKEGMQKENAEGREEIEEELNEEDIKSAASELIGKIKENVKNKAEDFGDLQNIFKFEEESDKPDSEEDDEQDLGSGKSAEWESGSNTVKDKKPSPDGVILEKPDPEELKDSEPGDKNDGKRILTAGSKKSGNNVEKSSYLLSILTLIFMMIL